MASTYTSDKIYDTLGEGRYMYVTCTQTQNIADNTSTINWTLTVAGGENNYYTTGATTVTINGTQVYYMARKGWNTKVFPAAKGSTSGSITVPHNADGSKSIAVSLSSAIYTSTISTKSGTWTLDKIPRSATITTAPNFTDEDNPTITYSNLTGNNVTSLQACISLTGTKDDIAYRDISKTGNSYTFNLTDAERKILRQNTTDSNSRTVRFYVRTTISGTNYYSSLDKTLTIINAAPTLTPSVTDIGSVSTTLTGDNTKMIKHFNTIQATTGAAAKKEATIKSQSITCGSQTITTATGKFNYVDTNVFVFKATDSRGNTVSQTVTMPMVNYVPLTCNIDAQAHLVESDSTKVNIEFTVSGNYFNGSFGAVSNVLELSYTIEDSSGGISYETLTVPASAFKDNTYTVKKTITNLNYKNSYIVIAQASDKINKNVKSTSKTLKVIPVFDWGENDFNFNVNASLAIGKAIVGIRPDGTKSVALEPSNANGNTILGYGGYKDNFGSTNVYGNNINIAAKDTIKINGREYGKNKILFQTTGLYMNGSQTVTLAEPISSQPNGIVLVFSLYRNGAAEDVSINSFFVSKKEVELLPNAPHTFFMMINSGFSMIGAKYLYIDDTTITGHDTNSTSGTNNSLTYNNNNFVLRYVIGV